MQEDWVLNPSKTFVNSAGLKKLNIALNKKITRLSVVPNRHRIQNRKFINKKVVIYRSFSLTCMFMFWATNVQLLLAIFTKKDFFTNVLCWWRSKYIILPQKKTLIIFGYLQRKRIWVFFKPVEYVGDSCTDWVFFGDTKINLCRIKITNKQFWPKSRGTHKKFPKIPNFKIMTKVIQHWSEQHDHNSLHVGRCLVPSMFILLIDLEDSLLSSWWSFSRNFLCDAEGRTRTWLLYWDSAQK